MPDVQGTWNQLTGLVLGIAILRWCLFALCLSLGLMELSWMLYKSLHHRGTLHSLIFAMAVPIAACVTFATFKQPWAWGLGPGLRLGLAMAHSGRRPDRTRRPVLLALQ